MTLFAADRFPALNATVRPTARRGGIMAIPMADLEAEARAAGLMSVIAAAKGDDEVGTLVTAFRDFKAHHNTELGRIGSEVDKLSTAIAAANLAGALGSGFNGAAPDAEYSKHFETYARKGASSAEAALIEANGSGRRAEIQAAMSSGDSSSGGYLAPVEWDRRVRKAQSAKSPMRRLATVVSTQTGGYTTLWNDDLWGSGWVGETAARPGTTTPGLSPIVFADGEIYANPAITQRLLDDADFDLEGWVASSIADEFDRQEAIAFISGNGTNKPFGLLQYVTGGAADGRHPGGNLTVVSSGHATTIPGPDVLVDFLYSLPAPYRANASWLMSSGTAAVLTKMKDADGRFIWSESLITGQPATLLGRPVEIDEGMPSVGAGNLPIAFGDFAAGYVINDRFTVRILRDPYTNKPYVHFFATKRVGAGVMDPKAIRLLKIAA